jgi:hypothetical protein
MRHCCNERVAVFATIGEIMDMELMSIGEVRECLLFVAQSLENTNLIHDLLLSRKTIQAQAHFLKIFLLPEIAQSQTPIVPTTFFASGWDASPLQDGRRTDLANQTSPLVRRPTAIRPLYSADTSCCGNAPDDSASLTRETTSCSSNAMSSVSPKYGHKNLIISQFSPDDALNA